MKKIRFVHIAIVAELIAIVYLLVTIFTPHAKFIDLKQSYLINKYINTENKMYNLYLMDLYKDINDKANQKLDDLKHKSIGLYYLENILDVSFDKYISVNDILVNEISKDKFEYNLNYLSNYRDDYKVDLVTDFDLELLVDDTLDYFRNFNVDMVEPSVELVDGNLKAKDTGKIGKKLNEEDFKSKLESSLKNYYNDDNLDDIEVVYDDVEVYPSVKDIEDINTKVSSFTTYYGSSGYSRKTNIAVATKNINGTLLSPGEVLSVDKGIKSINASNGYLPAGSYLNGKTVQTYGGGVCQVSTTLYGAVLRAGLIPIERNAHSMAISYAPLGLDAAISEGFKDLKIENTYDFPIYIQGIANGSAITFNIYGCEDLLDGYTYKPTSTSSSNGLYANSWLNKYKDGELVENIHLF